MSDDELRLRPTRMNGATVADDDFVVVWRELEVGRILRQPGAPTGKPNWFWSVNVPGWPQPADWRGLERDIEECKRRFRVVWTAARAKLTPEAEAEARRHSAEVDRRARWPGGRTK